MPVVYLTIEQVLELHARTLAVHGGASGLRSRPLLESAIAQPQQSAFGEDAYPTLLEKGVAYAMSLIKNHPFVDGNKRIGFATLNTFFVLNGFEVTAEDDDVEHMVVGGAAGRVDRDAFLAWVERHVHPLDAAFDEDRQEEATH